MIDAIGLVITLIALGGVAFYIVPKQIQAITSNARDWLTALRWQLLLSFTSILLASVPGLIVRLLRSFDIEPPLWLIDIAKISGSVAFFLFVLIWVLIYRYRDKR